MTINTIIGLSLTYNPTFKDKLLSIENTD